jgi:SAM-dependent methyltransferase
MPNLSEALQQVVEHFRRRKWRWITRRADDALLQLLTGLVCRIEEQAAKHDREVGAVRSQLVELAERSDKEDLELRQLIAALSDRLQALVSRHRAFADQSDVRSALITQALHQLFQDIATASSRIDHEKNTSDAAIQDLNVSLAELSETTRQTFASLETTIARTEDEVVQRLVPLEVTTSVASKKLDVLDVKWREELTAIHERSAQALVEAQEGTREELEKAQHLVADARSEFSGIIERWNALSASSESETRLDSDPDFRQFYLKLEQRHRGSRQLIVDRLRQYEPVVKEWGAQVIEQRVTQPLMDFRQERPISGLQLQRGLVNPGELPALDLGCGRGEWLEFLASVGWTNFAGVDSNEDMVQKCRHLGLPVITDDAIAYLEKLPGQSVALITGFHIVEHLPFPVLRKLVAETFRVLCRSGLCIFETPNPENILTASQYFHLDPTHNRPLPPDLLLLALEHAGFNQLEIRRMQPNSDLGYVADSLPREHPDETIQLLLNHFRACRDYAIVGRRP